MGVSRRFSPAWQWPSVESYNYAVQLQQSWLKNCKKDVADLQWNHQPIQVRGPFYVFFYCSSGTKEDGILTFFSMWTVLDALKYLDIRRTQWHRYDKIKVFFTAFRGDIVFKALLVLLNKNRFEVCVDFLKHSVYLINIYFNILCTHKNSKALFYEQTVLNVLRYSKV